MDTKKANARLHRSQWFFDSTNHSDSIDHRFLIWTTWIKHLKFSSSLSAIHAL